MTQSQGHLGREGWSKVWVKKWILILKITVTRKNGFIGEQQKIAIRDRRGIAKAISKSNKLMYWGKRRELKGVVLV